MSAIINTDSLNRTSQQYNPTLQVLPFMMLDPTMQELAINFLEVVGKDTKVTFLRKGNVSKPYVAGVIDYSDLGKAIERTLEVKPAYAALKDHIMNYKSKLVASNAISTERNDNKTKKHPLEFLILEEKVKTVAEDIISALFHAERDDNDKSPMGMFDGFNTHIANAIIAGEISVAKGNQYNTGSIIAPTSGTDTDAYDKVVAFIRSANPMLRKKGILYITQTTLFHAIDALGNKIKSKDLLEFEVFLRHLQGSTATPSLRVIAHEALGTGDNLLLTVPGNLDFGMNTRGDEKFVQVRNPFEDPNIVQFWTQWESGTRISQLHPKTFLVNNGVAASADLSGDYVDVAS